MQIPFVGNLQTIGIGLMLAGAASIGCGLYGHHKGVIAGRAEIQAKFDAAMLEATKAAETASENYRRNEADMRARVDAAEQTLALRKADHAKELASVRAAADADARSLRASFAALAAGGATPSDTSAPDGGCADAAGRLLGEALQTAGELAADAEGLADTVRALQHAWPE